VTSRRHDAAKEKNGMQIVLDSFNLNTAERLLCETALHTAGNIVEAAQFLGITRHALKRRIVKHDIRWPRPTTTGPAVPDAAPS
jgi:DNA-binding NtrC family response regulator